MPLADSGVPVDMRPERRFGIVGVKYRHVLPSQHIARVADCASKTANRRNVETCSQQMASVETIADRQARERHRQIADGAQFLETAAEGASATRGIFEQHRHRSSETAGSLAQPVGTCRYGVIHGLPTITAGMDDEIFRADNRRAIQLPTKRGDGFRSNLGSRDARLTR